MLVAGVFELSPDGARRLIRLLPVPDYAAPSLHDLIAAAAVLGSMVIKGRWQGYPGLSERGHGPAVLCATRAQLVLTRTLGVLEPEASGVGRRVRSMAIVASTCTDSEICSCSAGYRDIVDQPARSDLHVGFSSSSVPSAVTGSDPIPRNDAARPSLFKRSDRAYAASPPLDVQHPGPEPVQYCCIGK